MGAAERLKQSRRQRLSDEVASAATQFAARLVDALIEFDLAEADPDEPKPQRRKRVAMRIPFVPLDQPDSTPQEIEEARAARRRMGR